jgi:hypothetical protein
VFVIGLWVKASVNRTPSAAHRALGETLLYQGNLDDAIAELAPQEPAMLKQKKAGSVFPGQKLHQFSNDHSIRS